MPFQQALQVHMYEGHAVHRSQNATLTEMFSRFEQVQLAAHFVWSVQVQDTYCDYLSAWHIKHFTQKSDGEGFHNFDAAPSV